MDSLRVASLFSGCGGLDLGAELAGCKVVFGIDKHKDSAQTFKWVFPEAAVFHGDVSSMDDFPSADVLTGGYPCQSFSMGGRRNPDEDERSDLYLEFARALSVVRPKYFVAENVVGLMRLQGGKYFKRQLDALSHAGEGYEVSFARMDAHKFGLAQRRSRVLIVGVRRDLGQRYVFPEPTHGPGLASYTSHGDLISHLPAWPDGEFYERRGGDDDNFPWYYMSRNRRAPWEGPAFTVVANWRHTTLHPASPSMALTWSRLDDGFKQRWDFTGDHEYREAHPERLRLDRPRRLSWRECALLQGFPPNFEPRGNVQSKFTQIGNAVPPLLSRVVFEELVSGNGLVGVN